MNPIKWLVHLIRGESPVQDQEIRVELERHEIQTADRLSKLRGGTRDDVLKEAYRRARLLDEDRSYQRNPR